MSIGRLSASLAVSLFAAGFLGLASSPAFAEDPTPEVKECATQYQAAKAANTLTQPWQDFFTDCKAKLAPAAAKAPDTATPEAAATPKAEAEKAEPAKAEPEKTPAPAAAAKEEKKPAAEDKKKPAAKKKAHH
jgi:hypothetical protein